jgi:hypothetical protein
MNNTSVFIATPMFGGLCHGSYTKSLVKAMRFLFENGIGVEYRDMYNSSLITEARDVLTKLFLNSTCEYLLFIDADQSFEVNDIVRMIDEKHPVIGAVVPRKEINWNSIAEAVKQGVPPESLSKYSGIFNINLLQNVIPESFDASFEVSHVGTGMMLIHRQVFETLKPYVKKYAFNDRNIQGLTQGEEMYEFWNCGVDEEGNWASEDVNFCKTYRKHGGSVYAAPWAKVTHTGQYTFNGSLNPN